MHVLRSMFINVVIMGLYQYMYQTVGSSVLLLWGYISACTKH